MHVTTAFFVLCGLLSFVSLPAQGTIGYEIAFPDLTFTFPVEIQPANDGTDRLFVVEQRGRIRVFSSAPGTSVATDFLDMTDAVRLSSGQEKGLLGLAFHPDYATNGYFYVYYTRKSEVEDVNVELVLARYRVSATDPNVADPDSRLEIFSFDKNQSDSNHNGGKIAFGKDGYLYASIGDGGGSGDPRRNAQNLNTVFGSVIRIDVDLDGNNPIETNPELPDGNYEIPRDNPRLGQEGLDELFAWGIRNTWKFSLDAATGRMWGGDVGQGQFEEINLLEKGGNYGWNRFEANDVFRKSVSLVTSPDIKPVYAYSHDDGDKSITLGYVYRGRLSNPAIQGKLVFGDFVSGRVWAMDYDNTTGGGTAEFLFRTDGLSISSFGLDPAGELYFSGYGRRANLYRIVDENDDGTTGTDIDGMGEWQPVAGGVDGVVEAIARRDSLLYVGGSFTQAGSVAAGNVAAFDPGAGWRALGAGADGRVSALALGPDGRLYAGGDFSRIGGVEANNIAVWDGQSWRALGKGTDGAVLVLEVGSDGTVYAGGAFATAGGQTVNNMASWTGNWAPLTDTETQAAGTNNEVRSIAFDENGILYVGGNFGSAGDRAANRIATYDGSVWGTLGEGTSGFVQAIAITEETVYAGGNFALAGGETVNRIARWSRTDSLWQTVSGGVSGNVNDLFIYGDYLYLGGGFETVTTSSGESLRVGNVVRWSAVTEWQALGTDREVGADNQINTLVATDSSGLYAGGSFSRTGRVEAFGIAHWNRLRLTDGAVYELQPQHRPDLRLDVQGRGTADGTQVIGYERHGSANQQWTFIRVGEDTYELEPRNAPGQRLDVSGAGTANDAGVIIWRRSGGANQSWRALPVGDGTYRFEPGHAPGKRLDIKRVDGQDLALISELDGGNSQRWRLFPASGDDQGVVTSTEAPDLLADEQARTVSIYPNPASHRLTVESLGPYHLTLYDAMGRPVLDGHYPAGASEIAVDRFAAGMYVVRLEAERGGVLTRRVVVK
jgi:glucose/arabinose dehydrogenase